MISPYRITFFLLAAAVVFAPTACGSSSSNGAGPGTDAGTEAQSAEGGAADAPAEVAVADAPSDAPADVDNGAPSTNYPAPHPPLPQLTNQNGGPVLKTPKAYLVVYPGYGYETQLQDFAKKLATSTYWPTVAQEYGVGPIAYAGTIELTGQTAPQNIKSTDIQSWVATQIQSGVFGTPDPQAIYTIFYPSGTTVTQPNPVSPLLAPAQSCVAFGGYHDNASVTVGDAGSATGFAYAVIPTCGSTIDDITSVVSHEWVEASTDPLVTSSGTFTLTPGPQAAYFSVDADHVIWGLLGGGEAGDQCEPEGNPIYVTPADVGYLVQRTWSNLQAKGSHDPCAPDITGAFFDAAPVLTQTVTFSSSITGTLTTKGLTIPVGQSKTIEVDLFSDGDTGGAWTVAAADVLSTYYGNYGLQPSMTFAWDRTQGQNGEKLHLTITVTAASVIGGGHAFMITSSKGGRQAVWPGLVVEQ
jgi:hypothetical protein